MEIIFELLFGLLWLVLEVVLMGKWRTRRGDMLVRLDRFGYGYIFALAMGAVRFAFTARGPATRHCM